MKSAFDMTTLSAKGQIVIPCNMRTEMELEPGTKFLIYAEGDTLILKKVSAPPKAAIKKLLSATRKMARKAGYKTAAEVENDVKEAVKEVRKRKKVQ